MAQRVRCDITQFAGVDYGSQKNGGLRAAIFVKEQQPRSSLALRREAVSGMALVHQAGNDSIGGNATGGHVLAVRANDVFKHAVLVEEAIAIDGVVIADDDAIIVNTHEVGPCPHIITIIQGCKATITIDETVLGPGGIVGQAIGADDHAIVIEGTRQSTRRAREIRYAQECAVTAMLEVVVYSIGIEIVAENSVEVVDVERPCAVARGLGMYDQGCC